MRISVCPFSVAVFVATVAVVAYTKRQQQQQKDDNDSSRRKTTTTSTTTAKKSPSTHNRTCQVVFVLGGPGSGKGTQCQLLTQRLEGWAHLSAGDLLRAERKKTDGSPLATTINQCIAAGQLVPSHVTCQLIQNAMQERMEDGEPIYKFLIDGFPRSVGNLEAWEKSPMVRDGRAALEFCLVLDCPEEVMVGRLLERGRTSGRTDDTLEVIRKRFRTNAQETAPIVELYRQRQQIRTVSADQPVETVYQAVQGHFCNL